MTGRRPAALLAGLAAAAVLLVLGAASVAARGGSWARELPTASRTAVPAPGGGVTLPSAGTAVPTATAPAQPGSPVVGQALSYLLLALALVVLVALGAWCVRHRPRRRPVEAVLTTPADDARTGAIPAAVDRALVAVEQPDAREAVVQAWLLLGAAAADAGTPARAAETASEYADRLAAAHRLPAPAVHRLADLYREARFSDHPVRPDQRDAARAGLTELRTTLRHPAGTS